jgi:quercetin dioxygenase-like cupin family protein
MSTKHGKVWGSTREIRKTENFSLHRLFINAGGVCSKHKHNYKFNGFFVESGKLLIRTWKSDYDLVDETILTDLGYTEVAPPEYHQFEALEDTVCYEFYFNHSISEDIIRENRGFTKINTQNEP